MGGHCKVICFTCSAVLVAMVSRCVCACGGGKLVLCCGAVRNLFWVFSHLLPLLFCYLAFSILGGGVIVSVLVGVGFCLMVSLSGGFLLVLVPRACWLPWSVYFGRKSGSGGLPFGVTEVQELFMWPV